MEHAKSLAKRLAMDRTPGRIDAPLPRLEEMALAVAEARHDGINPRTSSKDQFAMREFEAFAELLHDSPSRPFQVSILFKNVARFLGKATQLSKVSR